MEHKCRQWEAKFGKIKSNGEPLLINKAQSNKQNRKSEKYHV
jgi:hypothetical protein